MRIRFALNLVALLSSITVGAGFALGGLSDMPSGMVAFCFFLAALALFVALLDLGYEHQQRSKRPPGR